MPVDSVPAVRCDSLRRVLRANCLRGVPIVNRSSRYLALLCHRARLAERAITTWSVGTQPRFRRRTFEDNMCEEAGRRHEKRER
jgi:hypothetical protein